MDVSSILQKRSALLSALNCFVKEWDRKNRPAPTELRGSFHARSKVIAGIVEANGMANPCVRANQTLGGDPDAVDMRRLVEHLVKDHKQKVCKFSDLVELCVQLGCFDRFTGTGQLDRSATAAIAKVFNSYADRVFQIGQVPWRFSRKGDGHAKRFFIERP